MAEEKSQKRHPKRGMQTLTSSIESNGANIKVRINLFEVLCIFVVGFFLDILHINLSKWQKLS